MKRSVKFYRDVLGFKIDYTSPHWSELKGGNFYLGLYKGTPVKPSGGTLPTFEVTNIKKTATLLKKRKVKFIDEPYEEDYGWLAVFSDPDGYCYELFQER